MNNEFLQVFFFSLLAQSKICVFLRRRKAARPSGRHIEEKALY